MEEAFIPPAPSDPHSPQLSATVLCVEDNAANLTLIERILNGYAGISLLTATEGRRGLEIATASRPDIILLDIHLPDMTGSDVITELQGDAALAQIPVVVLSADATEGQMRRMLELGAVAYLTKPIMLDEFDQVITSLLAPQP